MVTHCKKIVGCSTKAKNAVCIILHLHVATVLNLSPLWLLVNMVFNVKFAKLANWAECRLWIYK